MARHRPAPLGANPTPSPSPKGRGELFVQGPSSSDAAVPGRKPAPLSKDPSMHDHTPPRVGEGQGWGWPLAANTHPQAAPQTSDFRLRTSDFVLPIPAQECLAIMGLGGS